MKMVEAKVSYNKKGHWKQKEHLIGGKGPLLVGLTWMPDNKERHKNGNIWYGANQIILALSFRSSKV